MLIGNYSVLNRSPQKWIAGNSTAHAAGVGTRTGVTSNVFRTSNWRFFNLVDQGGGTHAPTVKTAAKPRGYYPGSGAYGFPSRAGEMSMALTGTSTVTLAGQLAIPATVSLTGTGDLDATAGLIIAMVLAASGSGTLAANIAGRFNAVVGMSGSGGLTATATGLAALAATLTGTGGLAATASGIGNMEIDIVVTGTGLTTANVGAAVWSALAAVNNEPGTMGEKLNDAGSASNPWTEVIEGGYTAAEMLKLIAAMAAGQLSGAPTGPIEIKGVDGTTTRITATVDTDGNRLTVTYNVF